MELCGRGKSSVSFVHLQLLSRPDGRPVNVHAGMQSILQPVHCKAQQLAALEFAQEILQNIAAALTTPRFILKASITSSKISSSSITSRTTLINMVPSSVVGTIILPPSSSTTSPATSTSQTSSSILTSGDVDGISSVAVDVLNSSTTAASIASSTSLLMVPLSSVVNALVGILTAGISSKVFSSSHAPSSISATATLSLSIPQSSLVASSSIDGISAPMSSITGSITFSLVNTGALPQSSSLRFRRIARCPRQIP